MDEFDSRRVRGCCCWLADPAEPGLVSGVDGEMPLLRLVLDSIELLADDAFATLLLFGCTGVLVLVAAVPRWGEF